MRFWDASALIPLCLQEKQTGPLKKLAQEDEAIVAWWGSPVECLSALARLRREDALQFAAALVWCQGDPIHHAFICLDQRLREAARREGFHILPRR